MEHFNKLRDVARANEGAASEAEAFDASRTIVRMAPQRISDTLGYDESGPVSLWLYIAGLCVTLSGLYAVNYNQEQPSFATMTYILAFIGYASSYLIRRFRVPYESLRVPVLVLVGLVLFAWLSNGQGDSGGEGHSALADRSRAMQMLCVWIALLQTFAAASDALVLFSCVPCMSLIALVSTTSPDTEVQYAFLVFIAAATFLMVHENFLRTRRAAVLGSSTASQRKLFGGQVQLAMGCVVCAFLLANFVAIPMHAFGRSLVLANGWGATPSFPTRIAAGVSGLLSNDNDTLAIGTGPVTESDAPVMRVEAAQGRNWRGATFDLYTGHSFVNQLKPAQHLSVKDDAADLQSMQQFHSADSGKDGETTQFEIPLSPAELALSSVSGAHKVEESVTVLNVGVIQCYAAGNPLAVVVPREQLVVSTPAGSVFTTTPFALNSVYKMTSVVPSDDPEILRAASSRQSDVPRSIAGRYLQLAPTGGTENAQLRQASRDITAGFQNNYEKAVAIRDYIAQHCQYNLQAPAVPADEDRVEHFLTVSKQGYCDSFAAAMTMLSRYAGIPARVATGYISGEADGKGGFVVRQKDKHAWSELFFPGVGWVGFDATEGSQDISDHSQHQQTRRADFVAWLFSHGMLPPLLLLAVAGLTLYLAWTELLPRLRRSQRAPDDGSSATNRAVVGAYLQACSYLERRGLHRLRSATPAEFLSEVRPNLATLSPEAAEALTSLTALHDRFHYGDETATEANAQEAAAHAVALKGALSRVSRKAFMSRAIVQQTT